MDLSIDSINVLLKIMNFQNAHLENNFANPAFD